MKIAEAGQNDSQEEVKRTASRQDLVAERRYRALYPIYLRHALNLRLLSRCQILKTTCLFLSLLTGLGICSGKFGLPITDDVSKLSLLKQNIPIDYEIPVHYIPKEVSGMCWVVLNIYPLEQSLRRLANMFGAISSNKENIIVFIAMLKSLRFTFDHEELETAMQVFQCHYQEGSFLSGLYFDYIKEVLNSAAQGEGGFPCKPPPCVTPLQTPDRNVFRNATRHPDECTDTVMPYNRFLKKPAFQQRPQLDTTSARPGLPPDSFNLARQQRPTSPKKRILRKGTNAADGDTLKVKSRRWCFTACDTDSSQTTLSDTLTTVSISIPLQTLPRPADGLPAGEGVPEQERW
ncbi:uncharacterized protein LOC130109669 [Lampris incognitus]|uniref:uncharacterized protein LOC130109669 n=1 Tax=Lampris incognitus TaxID=2546036 RepID=UPI0024B4D1E5|nr:uncharacterized protein LOC130109669 [Lampris incognitus]